MIPAAAAVVSIDVTASATSGAFALSGTTYPDGLRLDNIGGTSVTLSAVTASGAGLRLSAITAASSVVIQDSTFDTAASIAAVHFSSTVQVRQLTLFRTAITQHGTTDNAAALRFSHGVTGALIGGSAVSVVEIRECTIETASSASSADPGGPLLYGLVLWDSAFSVLKRVSIVDTTVSSSVSGGRTRAMYVGKGVASVDRFEVLRSVFSASSPKAPAAMHIDHGWRDTNTVRFEDSSFTAAGDSNVSAFAAWAPMNPPHNRTTVDSVGSWTVERCRFDSSASDGAARAWSFSSGVRSVGAFTFRSNVAVASSSLGDAYAFDIRHFMEDVAALTIDGSTFSSTSTGRAVGIGLPLLRSIGLVALDGDTITVRSRGSTVDHVASGVDVSPPDDHYAGYAAVNVMSFSISNTQVSVVGPLAPSGVIFKWLKNVTLVLNRCNVTVETIERHHDRAATFFLNSTSHSSISMEDSVVKITLSHLNATAASAGSSFGVSTSGRSLRASWIIRDSHIVSVSSTRRAYGVFMFLRAPTLVEITRSNITASSSSSCHAVAASVQMVTFVIVASHLSATILSGKRSKATALTMNSERPASGVPPRDDAVASLVHPHLPPEHRDGTLPVVLIWGSTLTVEGWEALCVDAPHSYVGVALVAKQSTFLALGKDRAAGFSFSVYVQQVPLLLLDSCNIRSHCTVRAGAIASGWIVWGYYPWIPALDTLRDVRFVRTTFRSSGAEHLSNVRVWARSYYRAFESVTFLIDECQFDIRDAGVGSNIQLSGVFQSSSLVVARTHFTVGASSTEHSGIVSSVTTEAGLSLSSWVFVNTTFTIHPRGAGYRLWNVPYVYVAALSQSGVTFDSVLFEGAVDHMEIVGGPLSTRRLSFVALHCKQRLFATRFLENNTVVTAVHMPPVVQSLVLGPGELKDCILLPSLTSTPSPIATPTPTATATPTAPATHSLSLTATHPRTASRTFHHSISVTASAATVSPTTLATLTSTRSVSTSETLHTPTPTPAVTPTTSSASSVWTSTSTVPPTASPSRTATGGTVTDTSAVSPTRTYRTSLTLSRTSTAVLTLSQLTRTRTYSTSGTTHRSVSVTNLPSVTATVAVTTTRSATTSVSLRSVSFSPIPTTTASAALSDTASSAASASLSFSQNTATLSGVLTLTPSLRYSPTVSLTATSLVTNTWGTATQTLSRSATVQRTLSQSKRSPTGTTTPPRTLTLPDAIRYESTNGDSYGAAFGDDHKDPFPRLHSLCIEPRVTIRHSDTITVTAHRFLLQCERDPRYSDRQRSPDADPITCDHSDGAPLHVLDPDPIFAAFNDRFGGDDSLQDHGVHSDCFNVGFVRPFRDHVGHKHSAPELVADCV